MTVRILYFYCGLTMHDAASRKYLFAGNLSICKSRAPQPRSDRILAQKWAFVRTIFLVACDTRKPLNGQLDQFLADLTTPVDYESIEVVELANPSQTAKQSAPAFSLLPHPFFILEISPLDRL